jgi:hypothetical protein
MAEFCRKTGENKPQRKRNIIAAREQTARSPPGQIRQAHPIDAQHHHRIDLRFPLQKSVARSRIPKMLERIAN